MPTLISWLCAVALAADPPANTSGQPSPLGVVAALESALGDAIEKAEPSVVAIAREKSESGQTTAVLGRNPEPSTSDPRVAPPPRPGMMTEVYFDYGAGVVVGKKGQILTAFHVVKGARRLLVRAWGGQSFEADVIAADPRSDLAVIVPRDVPDVAAPKLRPIPLGDATKLRKGSFLVALGNSFNAAAHDGRPSASWGILSNVARKIDGDYEGPGLTPLRYHPTLLLLDSKLNIGMGGGAVINLKGELVAVTTAAASVNGLDAQAGYAIPLDAIGRRAVDTLCEGKEVEYGFLGINLDNLGTSRVANTRPGTPAAIGGILVEDVVVAVNGQPVHDANGLLLAINALPAGATVKMKVDRQGEVMEKTVELAKFPILPPDEVISTFRTPSWRGLRVDYASQRNNTAQIGDQTLNALAQGGVVIVDVEPDSPAEKAGLKKGQLITQVDDQRVRSPRDFARITSEIKGTVTLQTDTGNVTLQ